MRWSALALSIGVGTSLLTNGFMRQSSGTASTIGSISDSRRLDITPRDGAFSIWAAIYSLLIFSAVYAGFQSVDLPPAILIAVAEVLTAVWVPLFLHNSQASLVASAAVLVTAAIVATVAVLQAGPLAIKGDPWMRTVAVPMSFGMFAGWLCCAAVLSVGIAMQAFNLPTPRWVLLLLAGVVALLAAVSRNPVLALPCVWALAWQSEQSAITVASILTCMVGAGAAFRSA